MERTSAERLRDEALRFLRQFGLVAALWATILAGTSPGVDRRGVLWGGIVATWVWALGSLAIPSAYVWWGGWLVVASGLELLGPYAGTGGWSVAGGASFLVLAGVALSRRRTWVIATVVLLSAVAVTRGIVADDWNVGGGLGTVLLFAFGGLALTWLIELVSRSLEERDRLQAALVEAETREARASERAENAARLHDTVLQHLTAIGRSGDLPEARRQAGRASNELRRFLRAPDAPPQSLRAALEAAATAAADGTELSVGVVGEAVLGEREQLLVEAAAEAVRNAACHANSPIRVFAEAPPTGDTVVWVSDRGAGFDPTEVPEDRLGVRESIVGRLERAGGSAELRSGRDGTEWELRLPRAST